MSAVDQPMPLDVVHRIKSLASEHGVDAIGGKWRRSSSRMCLGVEHGDYNGTDLFGVGTDRFLWMAYKINDAGRIRLFSANCPQDGVIDFQLGTDPRSAKHIQLVGTFPFGRECHPERKRLPPGYGF